MGEQGGSSEKDKRIRETIISDSLEENLNALKEVFHYPQNVDFSIREINLQIVKKKGAIVFIQGMVDENIIQQNLISRLITGSEQRDTEDDIGYIIDNVITAKAVKRLKSFKDIIKLIIEGNTILIIDGYREFICISNTSVEHRSIGKPLSENTVYGPKEAFVEDSSVNRSLIRKQLKTEDLVTEAMIIGETESTTIYIMYIQDIANQELVETVKQRIQNIKADSVQYTAELQQYIEDRPYSIIPSILYTERPDRVISFLREGHVAMLSECSPGHLIAPATFWSLFHTADDMYQRWFPGNFIRLVRLVAMGIALLIPSVYIAITNFHSEMIPTDLLLSIAANRERMPFPAIIELLIMELTFELLREAGLRIPTAIGPTIGIVGALILGQAAVEASIVSPILVIVVSITGLASFALPELGISFFVRIWRFLFIAVGAFLGFYGIAITLTVSIAYASTITSFGVPFFSPMAPYYKSSRDMVTRAPIWKQIFRPTNIKPKDRVRKKSLRRGDSNGK